MAEIRDDNLFKQPDENYLGKCPICCLPLSIDPSTVMTNSCCCKLICRGCEYANKKRAIEGGLEHRCPCCREVLPETDEEIKQNLMKRAKANDPVALWKMGKECLGKGDFEEAFGYFTKAAELGNVVAHYDLSCMYREGVGVEKDLKKVVYHLEQAAIGGHHEARYNLGGEEWNGGRYERAVKHYIIAANLGDGDALEMVKKGFGKGIASKEDYAAALRGHQAAVDATKSAERDEAEAFYKIKSKDEYESKEDYDAAVRKYHAAAKVAKRHREMAEIRDDNLFMQPDGNHLGECPICCLPLPLDTSKAMMKTCCSKLICNGCNHANKKREIEQRLEHKCPYCREPLPKTDEENNQNTMKRAKSNDPAALLEMGKGCYDEGDIEGLVEYYSKAAELGSIQAHYNLSCMHRTGEGVEKDEKKSAHHLEVAAIGGHPNARYNLGCDEWSKGNIEKAVRHFIIGAKLGDDGALKSVKDRFAAGYVSKEDFEAALRGHQAAVDATKSEQRDTAYAFENLSPTEQIRQRVQWETGGIVVDIQQVR
jgi:TPR repeat protein